MKNAHFILQGAGGVGSSTIAVLLAQYLKDNGVEFQGVDTNPISQTFSCFKSLNVKHLGVMEEGNVKQRRFDPLIEEIVHAKTDYIVDSGAAVYLPLRHYILENNIFELLAEYGVQVFLHMPVIPDWGKRGGFSCMKDIADMTTKKNLVVWENRLFGTKNHQDLSFEQLKSYRDAINSIFGVVELNAHSADTFGRDVIEMLCLNETFNECLDGDDFTAVEKSRLQIVRDETFAAIDRVGGDVWTHRK